MQTHAARALAGGTERLEPTSSRIILRLRRLSVAVLAEGGWWTACPSPHGRASWIPPSAIRAARNASARRGGAVRGLHQRRPWAVNRRAGNAARPPCPMRVQEPGACGHCEGRRSTRRPRSVKARGRVRTGGAARRTARGGNPAWGDCHRRPKMTKSGSRGMGTNSRCPSHSGGPPRRVGHPRRPRPR